MSCYKGKSRGNFAFSSHYIGFPADVPVKNNHRIIGYSRIIGTQVIHVSDSSQIRHLQVVSAHKVLGVSLKA